MGLFPVPYDKGIFNFHWFNFYNAICFQIIIGAPVVLLAKDIGASSMVLGVIAGFTPLLTVLQIPSAHHLRQYSYRSFALFGWSLRAVFIAIAAMIPLMAFASHQVQLILLLVSLFCFNLLRGISSAAFLPWLSNLVGSEIRGRFLAIDNTFISAASLLTMLLCAIMMQGPIQPWRYSLILWLSVAGSLVSLYYLSRIPDTRAAGQAELSASKISLRAMMKVRSFRNTLIFNLLFSTVVGGLTVFPIEYLRVQAHFSPSMIFALTSVSFIGGLLFLQPAGRRVDHFGSIPVIQVTIFLFAVILALWFAISSGIITSDWWIVLLLNFAGGGCITIFNMANTHLCLSVVPESGKNHFFAASTVITSLALGGVPIFWGRLLDLLGGLDVALGPFHLRRHSIYFLSITLLCLLSLLVTRTLREPRLACKSLDLLPEEFS